ncbi:hypothetical protein Tco_0913731 [Tanacetum coccineum]
MGSATAARIAVVLRHGVLGNRFFVEVADWDMERISKVACANVVGLVYGRDQGKHVGVGGFVDADYAKDPERCIGRQRVVFLWYMAVL